jgi:hypothetical protein
LVIVKEVKVDHEPVLSPTSARRENVATEIRPLPFVAGPARERCRQALQDRFDHLTSMFVGHHKPPLSLEERLLQSTLLLEQPYRYRVSPSHNYGLD